MYDWYAFFEKLNCSMAANAKFLALAFNRCFLSYSFEVPGQ